MADEELENKVKRLKKGVKGLAVLAAGFGIAAGIFCYNYFDLNEGYKLYRLNAINSYEALEQECKQKNKLFMLKVEHDDDCKIAEFSYGPGSNEFELRVSRKKD